VRRISPTVFRVARRGTSREINRQIALNLIREREPVSRADLARRMGLRRGAISRLVDELIESGLVFEGAKGQSARGRKPRLLHLEMRRRCAVAVDISASQTAILVTDLVGRPLGEVVTSPMCRDPGPLVRELADGIERILHTTPDVGECVGIGVAVSGLVELDTGLVRYSPTLDWRGVDLRGPLREATGLPVVVENSTKACVLAQVWSVRGDPPVDGPVAFVNVSDGVGAGVAVDGKLLRGAQNVAGEFGHVPLELSGPRCACGQRGCLEAFVSKRAVVARYRGTDPSWPGSAEPGPVSFQDILDRARGGENRALETLLETGAYLGHGLAIIIKAIDPQRIYVGGEITTAWDLVLPAIRRTLRDDAVVRGSVATQILTVPLEENPRLRGAAALITAPAFAAPVLS